MDVTYRRLRLTARELRGQLIVVVSILWIAAAVNMATETWYLRSGQVKGTDFVHFYTLARLGAEGRADLFVDADAQRALQLSIRPESAATSYPPAYGPQIALLLAPLGHLTYGWALTCWIGVTVAAYFALIGLVIRRMHHQRSHMALVMLAAAGYPPFWNLIQHGQLSALALAVVVVAWLALRRGSDAWAGAALGLLAFKPSLFVPLLAVLIVARAWRMSGAAIVTAIGQVLVTVPAVGMKGLETYGRLLMAAPRLAAELTATPSQMHSWRAFWLLLIPEPHAALALYALAAGLTIIAAGIMWRSTTDASMRMAVLLIATVLAAPHLYVYDLVVLGPVWIWLTEWYLDSPHVPATVGRALYAGYILPGLPVIAQFLHVQPSTLCFALLMACIHRYREPLAITDRRSS